MRHRPGLIGSRLEPLSGVAAVVLIVASLAAGGTTPAPDAPVAKLLTFYVSHGTNQLVSAALFSLGALFFLGFTAFIGIFLRLAGDWYHPSTILCIAGGAVLVVGMTILAGLTLVLGDVAGRLDPSALQALHVLSQEMVFTLTVGASAFMLGSGAAAMRTGALPGWLAWLAIVLGVIGAVPSHVLGGALDHVGFGAFAGLCAWTLIVGVLLAMRPAARGSEQSLTPSPNKEQVRANP